MFLLAALIYICKMGGNMKNWKLNINFILAIFFLILGVIAFSIYFQRENSVFAEKAESILGVKFSPTKIPTAPVFSNERVPVEIEDVKERLDREILINTYWHSQTFQNFKNASKYFPEIEKILKEEGVPDDFKFLALAESGLKNLVSPAQAAGPWQFLKDTGIQYGLEVNTYVDERYHLEKATRAACKYLKYAHQKFGSWTLAAASYNAGMERINSSLEQQKANNYYDLYLNEETSRYVFRIIALKEVFSNPEKYGFYFSEDDLYAPNSFKTLAIDSEITDLVNFSLQQNINYKVLKIHNPWLRQTKLVNKSNKTYFIKIPS